MIAFTLPNGCTTTGGNANSFNLAARARFNNIPPVNEFLSAEYCYALEINNTMLQVSQDVYPKSLPPGTRTLQRQ